MTNKTVIERIEQAHSVHVERFFYIAMQMENDELNDLLEEMDEKEFKLLFPEVTRERYKSYADDNELKQALCDYDKYGFIAELNVPECKNFSFDANGKPSSWSSSGGICSITYAYGETMEDFINSIEKASNKVFNEYVTKAKKKLKAQTL